MPAGNFLVELPAFLNGNMLLEYSGTQGLRGGEERVIARANVAFALSKISRYPDSLGFHRSGSKLRFDESRRSGHDRSEAGVFGNT